MLTLTSGAWDTLSAEALAAYPAECCGLLLGSEQAEARVAERAWPAPNAAEEAPQRHFRIEPGDFVRAEREAGAAGLSVLGIYHSHPDVAARPSRFDIEGAWPWYSYVIVAVGSGKLAEARSHRLADDRSGFHEEPLLWLDERGNHVRPNLDPDAAARLRRPTGEPPGDRP